MAQLKGIDISHHNNEPNWAILAKNVDFVYLKATEGNTYVDPKAIDWYNKAKKAGIKVGFYHFARFSSVDDGLTEAKFFMSTVGKLDVDIPFVLDIEVDDVKLSIDNMTKACLTFLDYVVQTTKHPTAIVYTYDDFIHNELGKALGKYPLWLADYGDHKLSPNSVWNKYVALQYTDRGNVLGINGGVDIDWMDDSMLLKKNGPTFIGTVRVNISDGHLNVRDKPDISGKVIGELQHDDPTEYKAYDKRFGWYKLSLAGAIAGWVSENYVTFTPAK
jgi:lysozyme